MRRALSIIGLQVYALLLAWMQALPGVRTDEAKYLLNIPYPHPPLVRSFMSLTESASFHELLWRVVLATFLVQAVWIVWDMGRDLSVWPRRALALGWLASAGMFLYAGVIVFSPLNALSGLILLWLARRPPQSGAIVGLLWLASLFTAYQAVLFAPLVWYVLRRSGQTIGGSAFILGIPLLLLGLYTLSNPLALTMITALYGRGEAAFTPLARISNVAFLWLLAGSGVVSVIGLAGLFMQPRWDRLATLALTGLFLFKSLPAQYYAILLTPLLIDGTRSALARWQKSGPLITILIACAGIVTARMTIHPFPVTDAHTVMPAIEHSAPSGDVLINGSFGHEWQYESRRNVYRFTESRVGTAAAVVCISACPALSTKLWQRLPDMPVEAWVRKG